MIRLAKINLAKKPSINLEKKTDGILQKKPPRRKKPDSPNPLEYEFEEPQEGLVPLFNSPFYATPDTPADPTDCNRYPDSPWCGENPFDLRPVAIELSIVLDECNIGVQFSGVFGFVKLPPIQIVFRSPLCQDEPPDPPPTFPPEQLFTPNPFPTGRCCLYAVSISGGDREDYNNNASVVWGEVYGLLHIHTTRPSPYQQGMMYDTVEVFIICHRPGSLEEGLIPVGTGSEGLKQYYPASGTQECLIDEPSRGNRSKVWTESNSRYPDEEQWKPTFTITKIDSWKCDFKPKISPPPPPKQECCKMGCCPNNSNLELLLRLILKKIGSDSLPASSLSNIF